LPFSLKRKDNHRERFGASKEKVLGHGGIRSRRTRKPQRLPRKIQITIVGINKG
jgi:hypothetical protein